MKVIIVSALARSLVLFRRQLIEELLAGGHQVLALAPDDDDETRATLEAMGASFATVPLRRTGVNPLRDAASMLALVRVFRRYRPQAILAYNPKPVIYGLLAARIAGIPTRAAMITGTGSVLGGGQGVRRTTLAIIMRGLYATALRGAHVVFFQNPDDERLFRTSGLTGRGVRVVRINGSGVDLDYFASAPIPGPPFTFLLIARLLRDKGLREYVQAARVVHRHHPDVRVQVLGPLDSNPTAIKHDQLVEWVREGSIEYLGETEDVRPFLASAHAHVLPSYGEGLPRSTLEAMAMGRPIITTDVPGCRETVETGRNGYLVPAQDANELATAMLRMIAESSRLEMMGAESRNIAEARFNVHAVNSVILAAMGLAREPGTSARAAD